MANDSVYFNGVAASLYSANDSQLVAFVQKYSGTGDVVVKVAGVAKTGPLFTYVWTVLENPYAGLPNANQNIGSYVDGPAASAGFWGPAGLALDNAGNLFVYDVGNSKIREITPPTGSGGSQVSTYASLGYPLGETVVLEPSFYYSLAGQGGTFFGGGYLISAGTSIRLAPAPNHFAGGTTSPFPTSWEPGGCAMDPAGNIYVTSDDNLVIIYKSGPGSWASIGTGLQAGDVDGTFVFNVANQPVPGDEPSFSSPTGVVVDSLGNIFVLDAGNYKIRKVTQSGVISTFAGNGNNQDQDGTGTNASFADPLFITIDASNNLYVLDNLTTLRKITPAGVVSTLCPGGCIYEGAGGITIDPAGHNLYVTEHQTGLIDQVSIF
jgi:serine/threonine protein kinase, bacterial